MYLSLFLRSFLTLHWVVLRPAGSFWFTISVGWGRPLVTDRYRYSRDAWSSQSSWSIVDMKGVLVRSFRCELELVISTVHIWSTMVHPRSAVPATWICMCIKSFRRLSLSIRTGVRKDFIHRSHRPSILEISFSCLGPIHLKSIVILVGLEPVACFHHLLLEHIGWVGDSDSASATWTIRPCRVEAALVHNSTDRWVTSWVSSVVFKVYVAHRPMAHIASLPVNSFSIDTLELDLLLNFHVTFEVVSLL